jgi:3-oxoacyl-(acyl-carrier-protein) synthase
MIGHTLGAAGALEAIVTIDAINRGVIHGTKNLENIDPLCDLDYATKPQEKEINYALSNSFGFNGHNVVLCFGRYNGD